jgi:hypothetical protein
VDDAGGGGREERNRQAVGGSHGADDLAGARDLAVELFPFPGVGRAGHEADLRSVNLGGPGNDTAFEAESRDEGVQLTGRGVGEVTGPRRGEPAAAVRERRPGTIGLESQ